MLLKIQLSVEKCIDDFCILCNKKYESDDEVAERIKIGTHHIKNFYLNLKVKLMKKMLILLKEIMLKRP